VRRLKELEKEHKLLKQIVGDQALDIQMLWTVREPLDSLL
jgi:hypothetical protein